MTEKQFNIQLSLVSHLTDERELILNITVYKETINAAKHALTKILRENTDPRLATLADYPGANPPRKIKWQHWKPSQQHATQSRNKRFLRIERRSKPITPRLGPGQKYVEAVILWFPKGL